MAYPDHHTYTPQDIEDVLAKAKNFDFVLTTEKDLQRQRTTPLVERLQAQGKRLIALPITMKFFTDQSVFDRQIITYVRENSRR